MRSKEEMITGFWKYHKENPGVYKQLLKLAMELFEKGHRKFGIKGLFEVVRWLHAIKTTGEEFKLCNNYTAFYARLILKENPSLGQFFDLKPSAADSMFDPEYVGTKKPIRTPVY